MFIYRVRNRIWWPVSVTRRSTISWAVFSGPVYRPLNDNIANGRIRGVAGVVGCNNVRTPHDAAHIAMIKELIKNDVLVLTTGCAAMACGKEGLLTPEAAKEFAGPGLAEVCETSRYSAGAPYGRLCR